MADTKGKISGPGGTSPRKRISGEKVFGAILLVLFIIIGAYSLVVFPIFTSEDQILSQMEVQPHQIVVNHTYDRIWILFKDQYGHPYKRFAGVTLNGCGLSDYYFSTDSTNGVAYADNNLISIPTDMDTCYISVIGGWDKISFSDSVVVLPDRPHYSLVPDHLVAGKFQNVTITVYDEYFKMSRDAKVSLHGCGINKTNTTDYWGRTVFPGVVATLPPGLSNSIVNITITNVSYFDKSIKTTIPVFKE
jgi:hypothetical protein